MSDEYRMLDRLDGVWVMARDPSRRVVQLGGVGVQGWGKSWVYEDTDDELNHSDGTRSQPWSAYPGYDAAPIVDSGHEGDFVRRFYPKSKEGN